MIFLMHVAATEQLDFTEQESGEKQHNLQLLMFLTHTSPWNKMKLIKPGMNIQNPNKVIILQN